ncbi:dTDP-glucose 4,6-dehydratase [Pseudonocardia sp. KRD-184]|uniref:dTDP-glucose 4,6-dehydratase n=1 Tax=Pseudonocardia oceani TaxID=2792013 RepID=A0ABS6U997_9PSEU|nr:dTDP-glucose 4,6-dehydratase [Pseudonocardia oceani]MBW0089535.1 dTDP-glucose 4,6-dehydratase [Pseudonocardia oceani]MBW0096601.1 dTDP-glucose 4,6-dehydratase [Pseudonocardia oceani]MBW0109774.1 dTDP-glucose 4,6-dehydratase [Pseudonocardia oceani]MBW0123419.1 dTDP-glucose 4,6-dehydratase [Pseudonocardia oceani]MBW0128814.1 dTDP-glucose 4,6-dehydratase [Pseudonocardia oceani]
MRVLVTGGAGFIGSHYVRSLLGGAYPAFAGAEVVVLDLLTYAGTLTNLPESDDRMRFVHGDIRDAAAVADVMAGTDVVVHFAAESHVDRSITGAADFVSTNVVGTQVLLQAALDAEVGRFVHVSTDEVYGSIDEGSWPETHPLEPNSPYSASKASSDLLARSYHRTHGLPVCITRCSNNYGPHQFPEKVIPLFVSNLLDGKKVPLYGDGLNVRDWLHVDDHCRGIQLVAEKGRDGEVYNIGGGTELTNRELTHRLVAAVGADDSMIEQVADRKGHDRRYSVDWSKIGDELGYAPQVPFDQGLADTVAWYTDNRTWWEPLRTR